MLVLEIEGGCKPLVGLLLAFWAKQTCNRKANWLFKVQQLSVVEEDLGKITFSSVIGGMIFIFISILLNLLI